MYSRTSTSGSTRDCSAEIGRLEDALDEADAVVIGAGSGLSTSAGFTYSGERFKRYFSDFEAKYGFHDMYTGGFARFQSQEEFWGYWSRFIEVNRYMDPPRPVHRRLLEIVEDRDYFVLTTNVDHLFQKSGFDKSRLFYTQGDYGLLQCSGPCRQVTFDNRELVRRMLESQGYSVAESGEPVLPEGAVPSMRVSSELVPRCPFCGRPLTTNLRCDNKFVEDRGWHDAADRYQGFLRGHRSGKTLFLDLGTGGNTPGVIKFPFWQMTHDWPRATYACVNLNDVYVPDEIRKRSICIEADIGEVLERLRPVTSG